MVDQLLTSLGDRGTTPEKELATLYQAGLSVTSFPDLPQLLRSTVESVAKLLKADVVTLYLYDQAKEDFVPPAMAVGVSQAFQRDVMPSRDGGAAKIAKKGRPIIANQAADDPDMSQGFIEAERITSSAGFPLKVGENAVGVLFLNFHDYHTFTPEDIEKVTIFVNQAAIAIRNAELFRQQEAANKRLRVLQQAQRAIDSASDLQEVLEQILSEGLRTVDTGRGSLMLIEGDNLVTKAQFGPEVDDPGHMTMTFKVGEGFAGIVAATGEAILCPDVLIDNRFKKPSEGKVIHFRSLLAVPIVSREGTVIGVISADDPEVDHFDQTHKQLLHDMAAQFATAIEKMILVETLHSLHKIFERITSVAIVDRELSLVLNEIVKNAVEILKIDVITIYQYDQERGKFIIPPLMKGLSENQRMQTDVFEGEAPWVLVHELKHHYYAPDAPRDSIMNPQRTPGKGPGFVTRESIKSSAGLLLKVHEEVVGIMFVNYRFPHLFLDREKQIIETFAGSAAIAIQDARQWENLKRTQNQREQTAKMSAVGTLVRGLAHELKNPLANILSSINLLEQEQVPQRVIPLKLVEMKSEVRRAGNIIDSLLDSVPPREAVHGPVDVLAVVNESLTRLENQAKLNHINIESELMRVPLIQGNATNLERVFFNILKNAIEAMPDGGTLRVSTTTDNVDVEVEVRDTGQGIAPEDMPHIFEPFFSTKKPGSGTGLGLAFSYNIVRDHQGDINVDSQLNKGSAFVVTLPIGERDYEGIDR